MYYIQRTQSRTFRKWLKYFWRLCLFTRTFQASNDRKKFNDFQGPVVTLKQNLLLAYAHKHILGYSVPFIHSFSAGTPVNVRADSRNNSCQSIQVVPVRTLCIWWNTSHIAVCTTVSLQTGNTSSSEQLNIITDHLQSGVVYNFSRVCLSVCQMITFKRLDVRSSDVNKSRKFFSSPRKIFLDSRQWELSIVDWSRWWRRPIW